MAKSNEQDSESRFAPFAVYTILHHDTLKKMAEGRKAEKLNEKKRWVTGSELFVAARSKGQEMAILYADAVHCSRLLYWGRLVALDVHDDGTRYTVADLAPLYSKRTQGLVLRSTNEHIAQGFIRPYAIVETPSFISRSAGGHDGGRLRGSHGARLVRNAAVKSAHS
jgi:hypothetical protein